jgi:peptidyl-dipeptidase Dcp
VTAIAQNPAPATFDNTLLPLECSGELLTRVTSVFFAMTSAHTKIFYSSWTKRFPLSWRNWQMIFISTTRCLRVLNLSGAIGNQPVLMKSYALVEVMYQRFSWRARRFPLTIKLR